MTDTPESNSVHVYVETGNGLLIHPETSGYVSRVLKFWEIFLNFPLRILLKMTLSRNSAGDPGLQIAGNAAHMTNAEEDADSFSFQFSIRISVVQDRRLMKHTLPVMVSALFLPAPSQQGCELFEPERDIMPELTGGSYPAQSSEDENR